MIINIIGETGGFIAPVFLLISRNIGSIREMSFLGSSGMVGHRSDFRLKSSPSKLFVIALSILKK